MNFKRIIFYIFSIFFLLSVSTLALCLISERAAYLLNFSIALYVRRLFAAVFSLLDFSLFEILVLASPVLIFFALLYINRAKRGSEVRGRFLLLMSILSILPSSYVFMIAIPNISNSPLSMPVDTLEPRDFVCVAEILASEVNELSLDEAESVTYEFLRDELSKSYSIALSEQDILSIPLPKPKSVCFSKALSYVGALAFYSPPTGEVNINTEIPAYMIPFTVAHEYAHYLGIGGEANANITAFIACEGVCDSRVRYSSNLTMLEYVLSDLYNIDREMYTKIYNSLELPVKNDIKEHSDYTKRYESLGIIRCFDGLNSLHGKAWNPSGESSYSLTGRMLVAYFKNNQKHSV